MGKKKNRRKHMAQDPKARVHVEFVQPQQVPAERQIDIRTLNDRLSRDCIQEARVRFEQPEAEEEGQQVPPEQQLIDGVRNVFGLNRRQAKPPDQGPAAHEINALFTVAFYPLKVVQVLIQLGYEPNPPEKRYSLIFRQYLYYYPGIIGYAGAIAREKGWSALYQGVGCHFVEELVTSTSRAVVYPIVEKIVVGDVEDDVPDNEAKEEWARFVLIRGLKLILVRLISETAVTVITYPFHVITLRNIAQVAQHIGDENLCNNVISTAREIYQHEGLRGFYAGFAPAFLGKVVNVVMCGILCIVFAGLICNNSNNLPKLLFEGLVAIPVMTCISHTYAYPFGLVASVMAVNNVRLTAGVSPPMPIFSNWINCYRHLRSTNSLYRGSMFLLPFPRFAYKEPPKMFIM